MSVKHVEVLVEEPSMEAVLRLILPSILEQISFKIYPHQCKHELLERLPQRLRGYAGWLPKDWRIVIVVDRDDEDCHLLKAMLEETAAAATLKTRSKSGGQFYAVLNRIVIEELEAWYFGDWNAVRAVYPRVPPTIPSQAKYRDPDNIKGGTWEAFERILQRAGYFEGGLRKIEAANQIAKHMNPTKNISRSFQVMRDALHEFRSS